MKFIVNIEKKIRRKLANPLFSEIEGEKKDKKSVNAIYNTIEPERADLSEVGSYYLSDRAKTEVLFYNGLKCIKKTYKNNPDGIKSFENELLVFNAFKEYSWYPTTYKLQNNEIIREFIPLSYRLDQYISNLDPGKKEDILSEILFFISDIFLYKIAHCDIHAKNIFVSPEGFIKVIDFETIQFYDKKPNFFNSYDITGKGLNSPYSTKNMGLLSDTVHKDNLRFLFDLKGVEELKEILQNQLKVRLKRVSANFNSRGKFANASSRVILERGRIYSTFKLEYLDVPPGVAQRNTSERLKKFGIGTGEIAGKRILDIGSNIGGMIFGSIPYFPAYCIGLEIDSEKVLYASRIASINGINNVKFINIDIEANCDLSFLEEEVDIVYCFAVIEHLKSKDKLFSLISRSSAKKVFFEGNAGTDQEYIKAQFSNNGFSKVNFIGMSDDEDNLKNNNRPMFIAERNNFI